MDDIRKAPVVKLVDKKAIKKDLKARKELEAVKLIEAGERSYATLYDLFFAAKEDLNKQCKEITELKEKLKAAEAALILVVEETGHREAAMTLLTLKGE